MGKEGIPVIMFEKIERMPVVHAGPTKSLVVYLESIGPDEMESAIGVSTQTSDVAGVLGNLGSEQYEVDQRR